MPRGNPSPKLAITVDPDIYKSILAAAAKEGVSNSWPPTVEDMERLAAFARAGVGVVGLCALPLTRPR